MPQDIERTSQHIIYCIFITKYCSYITRHTLYIASFSNETKFHTSSVATFCWYVYQKIIKWPSITRGQKLSKTMCYEIHILMFGFFFSFWVLSPTREFFTDTETSPSPMKGCKFLHMLGTYDCWSVMVV